MQAPKLARWLVWSVCVLCSTASAAQTQVQQAVCAESAFLQGAWEAADGGTQVLIEKDKVVLRKGNALRVATILKHEPCKLVVRDQGLKAAWQVMPDQGGLRLLGPETWKLRRLSAVPPELKIEPIPLPAPGPLASEEVSRLREELLSRAKKDQAALRDPVLKARRGDILSENDSFLRDTVRKVGWIDIPRFGKDAAAAAILIAKHASDLPLMRAALPVVEVDVKKHGGSGEMFSVLYDELQIVLGDQQRYGTQIAEDAEGKPFVLPVEDPSMVDVHRAKIGILPWREYLAMVSDSLYDGRPIRIAGPDE